MKERPILYSAPMVRAKLDGRKTQTRRIVKWRWLEPGLNLKFTGLSAQRLGRNYVGCELNPDYAAMAERRIRTTQPGLALS